MKPNERRDRKRKAFEHKPNLEDAWLNGAMQQSARAMAEWLKRTVHTDRQIRSLGLAEMTALAFAAHNAWVKAAIERLSSPEAGMTASEIEEFTAVLLT